MNIAVSGAPTPSWISAGPMITQLRMNDAVTGTARPRIRIAIAAKSAVSATSVAWLGASASAALTRESARIWPSPVLAMVEVMMPAAAHTAITGRPERMPAASAPYRRET